MLTGAQWSAIRDLLQLSPREFELVQSVFDCQPEGVIAGELRISSHTVHSYLKRLYVKLGVSSRTELLIRVFAAWRSTLSEGTESEEGCA